MGSETITSAALSSIAFIIYIAVIYLSILSWDEREYEESISRSIKIGLILGILAGILFNLIPVFSGSVDMAKVYYVFSLVSFLLAIMTLYPFISWVRKKIYSHFYIAAYLAYNVVTWYFFAPFFYWILHMDFVRTVGTSYLAGALLGTLLATAVIKEIRSKEIILGGLPAITTAISIADFGTKTVSSLLPSIVVMGFQITWVYIFLVIAFLIQFIYYKRIAEG